MTETTSPATSLSTQQFLAAVHAGKPRTAVFDFDGTLWPGDAGSGFMHWTIQTGLLSAAAAEHILNRHAEYHRGEVDETSICGEMVQIYGGLSEADVRASAAAYFQQHVQPRFFKEMISLVHELQADGVDVWVVSSTNNWMIEEGVRNLHVPPDRVLAASVAIEEGLVTETLLDVPSDEGKAEALRRVGLTHPDAIFGNSVHDLAMLRMARMPFPVNPTAALAKESAMLGWPIYDPTRVGTRASHR